MKRIATIDCHSVWREISNFLDGEVDAELRQRMEVHFRACKHCTAVLDGTRNVVALVADGQPFVLPEGFSERLSARIEAYLG